jgi:hypothetical protein
MDITPKFNKSPTRNFFFIETVRMILSLVRFKPSDQHISKSQLDFLKAVTQVI